MAELLITGLMASRDGTIWDEAQLSLRSGEYFRLTATGVVVTAESLLVRGGYTHKTVKIKRILECLQYLDQASFEKLIQQVTGRIPRFCITDNGLELKGTVTQVLGTPETPTLVIRC